MEFFLCVIGMVLFVEGFPYAASPEVVKRGMEKIMEMPDGALRTIGLALMVTGILLVYLGKG